MQEIEKGYFIQKSTRKNKKYDIYHNGEYLLSFGGDPKIYKHYKDTTPLKLYSHMDHLDKARRTRYYQRHGTTTNKNSAKYWSNRYLWF